VPREHRSVSETWRKDALSTPQGERRIDAHRAACGQEAGGDRDDCQRQRHDDKRQRVARRDAEELALDITGTGQTRGEAEQGPEDGALLVFAYFVLDVPVRGSVVLLALVGALGRGPSKASLES
jgi:hypothetical protein